MVNMQLKHEKFWQQTICGIMDVLEDFYFKLCGK